MLGVQALDPSASVRFLDTDLLPIRDSRDADTAVNVGECQVVVHLITSLLSLGLAAGDIGVVSPYRGQVMLLSSALAKAAVDGVEVLTVDKYQGRDKPCMVMSFVRSNQHR